MSSIETDVSPEIERFSSKESAWRQRHDLVLFVCLGAWIKGLKATIVIQLTKKSEELVGDDRPELPDLRAVLEQLSAQIERDVL